MWPLRLLAATSSRQLCKGEPKPERDEAVPAEVMLLACQKALLPTGGKVKQTLQAICPELVEEMVAL